MYVAPALRVGLGVLAIVRFLNVIWLVIVGKCRAEERRRWPGWLEDANALKCAAIAMILTITNTVAFSRCDKFSQASSLAGGAFSASGLAGSIASNMVGRFFK